MFQIIDVGGDNAVLNRILKREQYMWNSGYDKIIGLRDMYSREQVQKIDDNITQKFIKGANNTLKNKAKSPDKIVMCFAIMEIEAWLLAVYNVFEKLDSRLTVEYIKKHINIDLENIDPETEFFHPANQIEAIYRLAGKTYDKRKNDIETIASHITKLKYIELIILHCYFQHVTRRFFDKINASY
ncbi:MAG: hypothetical protein GY749_34815 [Desulfobacteraceae bacterium]|nr:hypothetical protein [Desulfobacteraceae bacterium]